MAGRAVRLCLRVRLRILEWRGQQSEGSSGDVRALADWVASRIGVNKAGLVGGTGSVLFFVLGIVCRLTRGPASGQLVDEVHGGDDADKHQDEECPALQRGHWHLKSHSLHKRGRVARCGGARGGQLCGTASHPVPESSGRIEKTPSLATVCAAWVACARDYGEQRGLAMLSCYSVVGGGACTGLGVVGLCLLQQHSVSAGLPEGRQAEDEAPALMCRRWRETRCARSLGVERSDRGQFGLGNHIPHRLPL